MKVESPRQQAPVGDRPVTLCVLGSINLDHVAFVRSLPKPGETITARESFAGPGGKGANQAMAAAREGVDVRMFGAVGADAPGERLKARLAEAGVDVEGVAVRPGQATGAAFITVAADGENHIVVAQGSNATVEAPDPARLAGCTVALAQLEVPVEAIARFFSAAEKLGAVRILNAAPALPEARALFEYADLLVFNEVELASYLGMTGAPDPMDARRLLCRPGQRAVVTLGAAGVTMVGEVDMLHVPARPVGRIVDTTGAGDAFCGSLAASAERREDWPRALRTGCAAAADCIARPGAG